MDMSNAEPIKGSGLLRMLTQAFKDKVITEREKADEQAQLLANKNQRPAYVHEIHGGNFIAVSDSRGSERALARFEPRADDLIVSYPITRG
jgi:hypothetical protein